MAETAARILLAIQSTVLHSLQKWERTLTRRDLTRLFVKFFGFIIIVNAGVPLLIYIPGFIVLVMQDTQLQNTWLFAADFFGPLAIKAAVGLCVIWWSGRIVDKASLAPEKDEIVEAPDLRNIENTLVAVLGLYLIAEGFVELCRGSFSRHFNYSANGSLSVIWHWNLSALVAALGELIIGILLVLGRGGIVAMRRRLHAWVRKWRTWPD